MWRRKLESEFSTTPPEAKEMISAPDHPVNQGIPDVCYPPFSKFYEENRIVYGIGNDLPQARLGSA